MDKDKSCSVGNNPPGGELRRSLFSVASSRISHDSMEILYIQDA